MDNARTIFNANGANIHKVLREANFANVFFSNTYLIWAIFLSVAVPLLFRLVQVRLFPVLWMAATPALGLTPAFLLVYPGGPGT